MEDVYCNALVFELEECENVHPETMEEALTAHYKVLEGMQVTNYADGDEDEWRDWVRQVMDVATYCPEQIKPQQLGVKCYNVWRLYFGDTLRLYIADVWEDAEPGVKGGYYLLSPDFKGHFYIPFICADDLLSFAPTYSYYTHEEEK